MKTGNRGCQFLVTSTGVHNLDVRGDINGDPVQTLKVGDYVEFRAIKPIAIAVRALN